MRDAEASSTLRTWGWLALLSAPAMLFPALVRTAVALPAVDADIGTFDLDSHWWQVRVLFPLVSVSAAVLLMTPGLMLALASRRVTSLATWSLMSVPPTLALAMVLPALLSASGASPGGRGLAFATFLLGAVVALVVSRFRRLRPRSAPTIDRVTLCFVLLAPLVMLSVLAPKFLWEDFNGDGAHAFEASRLLLQGPWPFFPASAGDIASFPGMTSMLFTFPNAWFLRLFGEVEAAVRVPYALYLVLLACALQALGEVGRAPLHRSMIAALWSSLAVFTLAIGFSASYSPYNADFALPAVQDTLLVVCFIGFAHAVTQRAWAWAAAFGFATYLSLPSGLLLIGFWMLAELLLTKRRAWQPAVGIAAIIAGSMLGAMLLAAMIGAMGSPGPGTEYGLRRTIADLMTLQLADWRRVLYAVIPGGIFPAVATFMWRRQDEVARRVAVVAIAYFAFFYIQSRISLHHFVPAMLLPLAVAVRVIPGDAMLRRRWIAGWGAAAAVAMVLSVPSTWRLSRVARPVAASMAQSVGSYASSDPDVFRAASMLGMLFPADWDVQVPDSAYGGSALVWLAYMGDQAPGDSTNYLLAEADAPVRGMSRVMHRDDAALYMRSESVHAGHRGTRPVGRTSAPVYHIEQRHLFQGNERRGRVDVAAILRRAGIDVSALLGDEARP